MISNEATFLRAPLGFFFHYGLMVFNGDYLLVIDFSLLIFHIYIFILIFISMICLINSFPFMQKVM